jgi:SAM-dependent methyltransferase
MLVETRGWLEDVVLREDSIELGGWAAPFDPLVLDRFTVQARGQDLAIREVRYPLGSDDVAHAFGELHDAHAARFVIHTSTTDRRGERPGDCLITVTPSVRDGGTLRQGYALYNLLTPSIPLPNDEVVAAVGGGFAVGFEFLGLLVQRAGLLPSHRVLDVGCGIGRMAYPLAYYLEDSGGYEGFDIVADSIEWASAAFQPRFPNVRFVHVDVWNKWFNPTGSIQADVFEFPYPSASFDFVLLASVFTHMYPRDVRHYLAEIARVLPNGGRVFATCFLLDRESRGLIEAGRSSQPFVHALEECWTMNPDIP